MLATKEMARKAVAGELRADLHPAKPEPPGHVGYCCGAICAPSAYRWRARQSVTAAYSGLLRCNNPMERAKHFRSAMALLPRGKRAGPDWLVQRVSGANCQLDSCTRSAHHNLSVINHREINEK